MFDFKKLNNLKIEKKIKAKEDPFINIGNIVRENRIKRNLSVEDLSLISKIPLSTIVGIEKNIKELLPQYPFTRSILQKLEECLLIEKSKLTNLVKKENISTKKNLKINFILYKFDIFNAWQGSFIYLLIILISLFALNSYYLNNRIIEFKYIENEAIKN